MVSEDHIMKQGNKTLKKIGLICLITGITLLIAGILLFIFTSIGYISWIIIASVVINIVGINLMTYKPLK